MVKVQPQKKIWRRVPVNNRTTTKNDSISPQLAIYTNLYRVDFSNLYPTVTVKTSKQIAS